jgi:glycerate kinase
MLDASGHDLEPGGAALRHLDRIAAPAVSLIDGIEVVGATDVTNPLCGPQGASAVYGPQKGADEQAIIELDAALSRLAEVIRADLGVDVAGVPGAGAAGGLGAALIAFLGARLQSGAQVVGEAAGIAQRVSAADFVITGEGRLDGQTAFGKTPQFVSNMARADGKPVGCVAGSLGPGHEATRGLFDAVQILTDGASPLPSPEAAARQVAVAGVKIALELALIGRIDLDA